MADLRVGGPVTVRSSTALYRMKQQVVVAPAASIAQCRSRPTRPMCGLYYFPVGVTVAPVTLPLQGISVVARVIDFATLTTIQQVYYNSEPYTIDGPHTMSLCVGWGEKINASHLAFLSCVCTESSSTRAPQHTSFLTVILALTRTRRSSGAVLIVPNLHWQPATSSRLTTTAPCVDSKWTSMAV